MFIVTQLVSNFNKYTALNVLLDWSQIALSNIRMKMGQDFRNFIWQELWLYILHLVWGKKEMFVFILHDNNTATY